MKNRYIFKFSDEISSLDNKIKLYNNQFKKIIKKYNNLEENVKNYIEQKNIMFKYREEMLNLMKMVVKDYPYFNNNAVIYLTGSYSRNTVRMFSDLDLNIIYIRGTGKKYMKYEELFYYYICKIFEMNRCGVHSIVTAFNDSKNYQYVTNNKDNNPINISLIDNNNTIEYTIEPEYKKRFYLQYMNNKNYKVIFDNLIYKNKKHGIQEWSNNFLFLNENIKVREYYNKYQQELISNLNYEDIKNKIDNVKDFDCNYDFKSNVDIKKCFQMDEFHYLYEIIILMQSLNAKEINKIYSDYNELYVNSNKKIRDLLDKLYEYNFYIYKLNLCFEKYDIPYSIHNYRALNFNNYEDLKKILDEMIKYKNDINKKFLSTLKGEIYNDTK